MNENGTPLCEQDLRAAIREVFTTMVFMNVEDDASALEAVPLDACVVASLSFMGPLDGSLDLCGSLPCARTITANLLAMDEEEPLGLPDIADAMGEIANMTLGSIKSRHEGWLGELMVSVPNVFTGKTIEHHLQEGERRIATRVALDDAFCLEIHMNFLERNK